MWTCSIVVGNSSAVWHLTLTCIRYIDGFPLLVPIRIYVFVGGWDLLLVQGHWGFCQRAIISAWEGQGDSKSNSYELVNLYKMSSSNIVTLVTEQSKQEKYGLKPSRIQKKKRHRSMSYIHHPFWVTLLFLFGYGARPQDHKIFIPQKKTPWRSSIVRCKVVSFTRVENLCECDWTSRLAKAGVYRCSWYR